MKTKKEILLFLLVQPLLISNPYPLVAQGLEEVIKKYTDSIWGDTELDSVKSLRTFSYFFDEQGNPKSYVLKEIKIPNLIKIEYFSDHKNKGYTIAYDGEIGWELSASNNYTSPVKLSNERSIDLSSEITIIEPFLQPEKIGAEVKLNGKKKFIGTKSHELIVTLKDGTISGYYIDSEDYRLIGTADIMIEDSRMNYSELYYFKDFRMVDGINFSFLIEQKQSNVTTNAIKIIRIEVNPKFSENHFKMP